MPIKKINFIYNKYEEVKDVLGIKTIEMNDADRGREITFVFEIEESDDE